MRRPDVFTLDYSHPLAHGLVFAGLGPGSAAGYPDSSLSRIPVTITNYNASSYWTYKDGRYWLKPGALTTHPSAQVGAFGVLAAATEWCVSCRIDATANSDATYPAVLCRPLGNSDVMGFRRSTRASCIRFGSTEIRSAAWGATEDLAFLGDNFWGWNRRVGSVDFYKNEALSTIETAASYGWGNVSRMFCSEATTTSFFDAFVADLLIHNRALSPAEVAILADRTDPMLGGLIVEERPVLWFDMGGSTTDDLTATDLITGSPVLGTPALGQAHALTASNLTTSAPVLGTPALSQVHALTATALVVGSPALGTPSLTENAPDVDALTAVDLVVGSPALGTPAFGQIHVLGSDGLVTGSPVLCSPSITQIHTLEALGLTVGVPVLGTPAINGSDIVLITAAEVARIVRATSRMKTVTASARVKQVRYEVTRA